MDSDLTTFLQTTTVADTHEHMRSEEQWLREGPPDVLADIFSNYSPADLVSAGMSEPDMTELLQGKKDSLERRWATVQEPWKRIRFTGYGEAVAIGARELYGIEELSLQSIIAAQPRYAALRRPGAQLKLFKDAGLDHMQINDLQRRPPKPDAVAPEFYLYDLSWVQMSIHDVDYAQLAEWTGVTVKDLATLRQAIEAMFARYGRNAIAVKLQQAYSRPLWWEKRSDAEAELALQAILHDPKGVDVRLRHCLGDWCLARGVEQAGALKLPVKFHTGYIAGTARMQLDDIRPAGLCALLREYPQARFVFMHMGYPYSEELISLAKHYTGVYASMCWAWSIAPRQACEFVRRFIHTAPVSKLLAFGGDSAWPTPTVAYCRQMRKWLTRALEQEVADGDLSERQAIEVAGQILRENHYQCFDIEGLRGRMVSMTPSASPKRDGG